ncbi:MULTISPECIES: hypothetical protein [Alicyclobacillus]|uniref:Uncharacterized protein n=1 Tax=Alicyclobacillus acidoterrestris (strain ATCC 49025 / DSM 3922 / CIP 106132 / NCIMB 13137 / GD3B) TaxID=1356854 RepID=T0BYX1_ALIAG|nr:MULTISPECIES: hypothetical protein [Alicyclobacillus]EPZ45560.1 hypothetical protein N007_08945 [Alicyclobacillus acidoterrestris ATCC 49025]UNO49528.1 hypothetical protein K1I37_02965 [Alicyclobacillus acidoterrestris]
MQELLERLLDEVKDIRENMDDLVHKEDLGELRYMYRALLEGQEVLSARFDAFEHDMVEVKATLLQHSKLLEGLSVKVIEHDVEIRRLNRRRV